MLRILAQEPMKFEYWKSANNNNWYWHLKAANGEKIAQSEGYASKQGCLNSIELVKSCKNAEVVEK